MEHVGIDLGKAESQISILTEAGELVGQRIRTERDRFVKLFGVRPRARILIEASTESEWVARCLEEYGHEVIVADPRTVRRIGPRITSGTSVRSWGSENRWSGRESDGSCLSGRS